jgi:enolase-phosphatase E1
LKRVGTFTIGDAGIRALLLDIEGTTTSVDFVYQTLFPHARRHLREYVESHYGEAALAADFEKLRQEHAADAHTSPGFPPWREDSRGSQIESVAAYVSWLMDQDRKSTGLKSLQGKIWEQGYRSGELKSHLYPDVLPAFERWRRHGKAIAIFSSGSVLAQKLLFAHTCSGDLSRFIGKYFDTTTGAKTDAASYHRIAETLALAPAAVLFLSDTAAELDAARSAGMHTALCVRPGRPQPDASEHPALLTFDELFP